MKKVLYSRGNNHQKATQNQEKNWMMALDMCWFLHRTFQLLKWEDSKELSFLLEINVHKTRGETNTHKNPCIISEEEGDKIWVKKSDYVQGQMICNRRYQKFKELSGPKIVSLFN